MKRIYAVLIVTSLVIGGVVFAKTSQQPGQDPRQPQQGFAPGQPGPGGFGPQGPGGFGPQGPGGFPPGMPPQFMPMMVGGGGAAMQVDGKTLYVLTGDVVHKINTTSFKVEGTLRLHPPAPPRPKGDEDGGEK